MNSDIIEFVFTTLILHDMVFITGFMFYKFFSSESIYEKKK